MFLRPQTSGSLHKNPKHACLTKSVTIQIEGYFHRKGVFREGRGAGTAFLEAKLPQKLTVRRGGSSKRSSLT